MTIAIVLLLIVLAGLVVFGYSKNKKRSVNKTDAMKSGEEVRHDPQK